MPLGLHLQWDCSSSGLDAARLWEQRGFHARQRCWLPLHTQLMTVASVHAAPQASLRERNVPASMSILVSRIPLFGLHCHCSITKAVIDGLNRSTK